jgi:hypothetical protein
LLLFSRREMAARAPYTGRVTYLEPLWLAVFACESTRFLCPDRFRSRARSLRSRTSCSVGLWQHFQGIHASISFVLCIRKVYFSKTYEVSVSRLRSLSSQLTDAHSSPSAAFCRHFRPSSPLVPSQHAPTVPMSGCPVLFLSNIKGNVHPRTDHESL